MARSMKAGIRNLALASVATSVLALAALAAAPMTTTREAGRPSSITSSTGIFGLAADIAAPATISAIASPRLDGESDLLPVERTGS